MERKILEKDIEQAVCKYAKLKDCLVYKFVSPSTRGLPDRIFINPSGKYMFIEFKRPNNKPTELQKQKIKELINHQCRVFVIDNISEGKEKIDEFIKD